MRALPIAALLLLAACANNGAPGQADGLPNAAATAFHSGSPQVALQIDAAILARDPRNVAALLSRGDAQTALQQPDRAAETYNDALRADPHSALARIGLGRLRLADDPSAAEAWFLEASQADPHNAVAWNDLGIARDLLGRHQDAQAAYRRAIGLDASMRGAQVNLALSLAITGRTDDTAPPPRTGASTPAALPESLTSVLPAQAVAAVAASPALAPTPASTPPQIVLTATADAWMQVRDKSGQVLLSRILHPGESWSVPARPELVLTTGNAGGTDIVLAGVAIPSLGPSGAVRRNIPLDAELLMAGKLPSTSRSMAAASAGSPVAPPAAASTSAPSAGRASAASGSALPAATLAAVGRGAHTQASDRHRLAARTGGVHAFDPGCCRGGARPGGRQAADHGKRRPGCGASRRSRVPGRGSVAGDACPDRRRRWGHRCRRLNLARRSGGPDPDARNARRCRPFGSSRRGVDGGA